MMKHFTCGVLVALIASAFAGPTADAQAPAAKSAAAAPMRDISGFWTLSFDSRKVPTAKLLPRITRTMIDLHARRDVHAMRWCNLLGTPFVMDSGTPIDIRQGPTTIVISPENNPAPRYLYLNRKHVDPNIYDQSTNGDSIASWEGDTLVVDTIGFAPRVCDSRRPVMLTPGGGRAKDTTHLVERYRLVNADELSVTFTWEDATVLLAPHTYSYTYKKLAEGTPIENNEEPNAQPQQTYITDQVEK